MIYQYNIPANSNHLYRDYDIKTLVGFRINTDDMSNRHFLQLAVL